MQPSLDLGAAQVVRQQPNVVQTLSTTIKQTYSYCETTFILHAVKDKCISEKNQKTPVL